MKEISEQQFYDRLNELEENEGHILIGYFACALSGFIMGFAIGYCFAWLIG